MRHDLMSGRRLRFPVEIGDRESIPGAIVRGVRQHVLFRTAPVLEAAGVRLRHVGLAQIATPDELERLAYVTRCPANDLIERGGERIVDRDDDRSYEARFGRLVIPRAYLDFRRRRIGPVTLGGEEYHRASWMNALLPYCPESLERLIDTCSLCAAPLGWFHSHGVAHCDSCGERVEKSGEAPLCPTNADDYRLFALLSSPDARGVEDAWAQMPAVLQVLSPGSLVRLALLLGALVQPGAVAANNRNRVATLPAPTLAAVVSAGTALLRSWPTGLREWVAARTEELRGSPERLTALRARMKRITDRQLEPAEIVETVVAALPDLHRHAAHGFTTDRPYYLYKHVQNTLGLTSLAMEALKGWAGLKFLKLNTAAKEQGQFDVDQIDGLVPVFRDTMSTRACAQRFHLPLYAIEQLCAAGILEWEDHPALHVTGVRAGVRGFTIRRLTDELLGKIRHDEMPADCVCLAIASKRIGGRLKPWASIVHALRNGRLAFWADTGRCKVTSFRIRATDLTAFQMIVDDEAPADFPASPLVSQEDAAEILNVAPKHLPALGTSLDLSFARRGKGLFTSRDAVLAVAAAIAWNAEVALHEDVHHRKINDILIGRGIGQLHTGWSRRHLIVEGIIPPSPRLNHKHLA